MKEIYENLSSEEMEEVASLLKPYAKITMLAENKEEN